MFGLTTHRLFVAGSYGLCLYLLVVMGALVGASTAYDADTAANATVELNETHYVNATELNGTQPQETPLTPLRDRIAKPINEQIERVDPTPDAWKRAFKQQFRVGVAGFVNGHLMLAAGVANTTAAVVYPIHEFVPQWLVAGAFQGAGVVGIGGYAIGVLLSLGEVFNRV